MLPYCGSMPATEPGLARSARTRAFSYAASPRFQIGALGWSRRASHKASSASMSRSTSDRFRVSAAAVPRGARPRLEREDCRTGLCWRRQVREAGIVPSPLVKPAPRIEVREQRRSQRLHVEYVVAEFERLAGSVALVNGGEWIRNHDQGSSLANSAPSPSAGCRFIRANARRAVLVHLPEDLPLPGGIFQTRHRSVVRARPLPRCAPRCPIRFESALGAAVAIDPAVSPIEGGVRTSGVARRGNCSSARVSNRRKRAALRSALFSSGGCLRIETAGLASNCRTASSTSGHGLARRAVPRDRADFAFSAAAPAGKPLGTQGFQARLRLHALATSL